jgi:DNA-binding NarL/FixJ family response regulator
MQYVDPRSLDHSGISIEQARRTYNQDIYQAYRPCRHLFTPRQWAVVELRFGQGLSNRQTARLLGIEPQTASGHLTATKRKKLRFDCEQRMECAILLQERASENSAPAA